jgi:hypothetical protein
LGIARSRACELLTMWNCAAGRFSIAICAQESPAAADQPAIAPTAERPGAGAVGRPLLDCRQASACKRRPRRANSGPRAHRGSKLAPA